MQVCTQDRKTDRVPEADGQEQSRAFDRGSALLSEDRNAGQQSAIHFVMMPLSCLTCSAPHRWTMTERNVGTRSVRVNRDGDRAGQMERDDGLWQPACRLMLWLICK
ncbi:uncharacterized protein L969DRAFT_97260 [Mixia osmundae IAM 14324]|uniref:Uncharacterized protein n=1 Tax=Mixia osmundae (strain CBS 9802 / IAM 14324 / JCM 22182 / KY 12970) TaxID=764103 RepID=G7DW88_MIXOS|nr:uncharacterized protein L969DRAFT_97260 [Mixia osmundae IAM 14324]KEI36525.1 hypothetical protein L969DRAFT_97260 [Mixia osmundae IAM 14324]GAA94776.1 hypothetical protein E5Q_01430 [Mixia osmundae IAM 14324]